MSGDGLKTCRYLTEDRATGGCRCAYWDDTLRGDEDIRCHPGGWECYEAPGGYGQVIPWDGGRWLSVEEFMWLVRPPR